MDDQVCPKCKTTKYRNPSLKLMVNVCGHALCESCVELLFIKGKFRNQNCMHFINSIQIGFDFLLFNRFRLMSRLQCSIAT